MSIGLTSIFDFAKGIMDRVWPEKASEEEKMKAAQDIIPLLQQREDAIVEAKKSVMMAELQQGDTYTKRARPTVVYGGLLIIFLNWLVEAVVKMFNAFKVTSLTPEQVENLMEITNIELPGEFWAAWGGVVSVWIIGRSAEKRGSTNKIISMITGNK